MGADWSRLTTFQWQQNPDSAAPNLNPESTPNSRPTKTVIASHGVYEQPIRGRVETSMRSALRICVKRSAFFRPPWLLDWARLVQVRFRYRNLQATIWTPDIEKGAELGFGCILAAGSTVGADVRMGDFCATQRGVMLSTGILGNYVTIGHNAIIGPENHATDHVSTHPGLYNGWLLGNRESLRFERDPPPQIGHDVWIGATAIITQGVTIGTGAIVAAGAVVTKDVEPYSVVAGIPAKRLRYRFPASTIEFLLASQWWTLPLDQLQKKYGHLFVAGSGWDSSLEAEPPATGGAI